MRLAVCCRIVRGMASRPVPPRPTSPVGSPRDPLRPASPWMVTDEVAPFLRTTAHTLRRLAREGRWPILVRRVGGCWRFSRVELQRFLDGDDLPGRTSR